LAAVNPVTIIFLAIGALGIMVAAITLLGGSLFDIGDGFFSTEAAAAFVAGFGFASAAAYALAGSTVGVIGAGGLGVIVAVPLAFLAARMVERVGNMPTDATPTATDLAGARGVVVTPVPAGGFGEVRVRVGGQPMKLYARATKPIALGAAITVTEALSETSVIVMED
jgi:membrane protein implicated in regulation of membrane protease activity